MTTGTPSKDDKEEYGEVTRCVCGDDDDESGFMIQCDTEGCRVWQHGECVGLTQETVPDKYYCEKCQPDHPVHVARRQILSQTPRKLVKGRGGKTKSTPKVSHKKKGPQSKKRKKPRSHEEDPDLIPIPAASPIPPPVNMIKRLRTRTPTDALPSPISRTTRPSREDRELQKQLEKFQKMENQLTHPASVPPQPSPPTIQKNSRKVRAAGRGKTESKEQQETTARGARARMRAQAKAQTKPNRKPTKKETKRPRIPRPPSPGKSPKVSLEELAWERRKDRPLTPMYLGKKHWLLRDWRQQQERTHCDYHRRYMDSKIPIKKRILLNYLAAKVAGDTVPKVIPERPRPRPVDKHCVRTTKPMRPKLPDAKSPSPQTPQNSKGPPRPGKSIDSKIPPVDLNAKIPLRPKVFRRKQGPGSNSAVINGLDPPPPLPKKTISAKYHKGQNEERTVFPTVTTRSALANSRQLQNTAVKR